MSKLMNFDFQFNNKENIGVNGNLISNITECNQIPVLPNYVSNIRQKNPNIFDNYDFHGIINYDDGLKSEKRNIIEVFKNYDFKEDSSEMKKQNSFPKVFKDCEFERDLNEETKKTSIKTPFVRLFLFLIS